MLESTSQNPDLMMIPYESQKLNITKLFYLHLRKNLVDIGNFDNDLNKILESYDSNTPSASNTLPTDAKSASLKAVLEKIQENNKPKISEVANEAIEETPQQVKDTIKETLGLYKEYFSIKLSFDGNPDSNAVETKNILNNFTKNEEGSLVKSIDNSSNNQHNLELRASLKRYLGGLLVKAESKKNNDTPEDQKDNIEEIKNILAIFPGGVNTNGKNEVDFACIAGTKERVDDTTFALNDLPPEVRAMKSVIDKFTAQLAPKVRQGSQIHTSPCIELSLAVARNDIKDPNAVSPQEYITLREILDFSYNLNKMIEKEFEISKERLVEDYGRLFKKIEEISQKDWVDPDQKENTLLSPELKKQAAILKKINIFVEQVNNSGFNIKSAGDILQDDCDLANITTASLISSEELKEKYSITIPSEKFQQELSAVTADRLPKHDYLKHLLDPKKLFKDSSESGNESLRLDVKKIKNLVDLFQPKIIDEAIDEEVQNTQKSKMLAGLVTLRNILDGYETSDNNYFYFLKFDKKFKEENGKSFEDFFYKNINGPLVDGSPEVKAEFQQAKPILDTIASRLNSKHISFRGEKAGVNCFYRLLVSDEEKKDRIKELFTHSQDILELRNSSGENIAKILHQFSEEVLLTALEANPKLLEKIIETNNVSHSILKIITQENNKELSLNILKKYQEAHKKEGDEDGKNALGEMIYKQNILFDILKKNQVDLSKAIIQMLNIEDLNKPVKNGFTPLLIACFFGRIESVKELIKAEVDINKANINGVTPLYMACQNGHLGVVKELIEAGVNLNKATTDRATPLHVACQNGHIKIVKELIEAGAGLDDVETRGATPLYIACQFGHIEIAKELIEAKVDINKANINGVTPLYMACQNGHLGVVEKLIEAKVDINKASNYGFTPLYSACEKGHVKIVKELIKAGVDLSKTEEDKATPLHIACENGHLGVVKELIKAGPDLNKADKDKATPLYSACEKGHVEIVKELIEAGADLNKADKDKATPLYTACENGHLGVVKELIKAGADLNKADEDKATPLYIACKFGRTDIADDLFKAGANVDCLRKKGTLYGYYNEIDPKLENASDEIKKFINPEEIKKRDERLKNINKPNNDAISPSGVVLDQQAGVQVRRVPS
jgi:cytohesin